MSNLSVERLAAALYTADVRADLSRNRIEERRPGTIYKLWPDLPDEVRATYRSRAAAVAEAYRERTHR